MSSVIEHGPPQHEAGLGRARKGDGEYMYIHICRHVARGNEQPRGLLGVQGNGQDGRSIYIGELLALAVRRHGSEWVGDGP